MCLGKHFSSCNKTAPTAIPRPSNFLIVSLLYNTLSLSLTAVVTAKGHCLELLRLFSYSGNVATSIDRRTYLSEMGLKWQVGEKGDSGSPEQLCVYPVSQSTGGTNPETDLCTMPRARSCGQSARAGPATPGKVAPSSPPYLPPSRSRTATSWEPEAAIHVRVERAASKRVRATAAWFCRQTVEKA